MAAIMREWGRERDSRRAFVKWYPERKRREKRDRMKARDARGHVRIGNYRRAPIKWASALSTYIAFARLYIYVTKNR